MSEKRVRYIDLDDDGKRERIARMKERSAAGKEKHSKSSYYSWRETIKDIKDAQGAGETAVAGAKLAGKSLFNIGKFTVGELIPGMLEFGARQMEESLKKQKK